MWDSFRLDSHKIREEILQTPRNRRCQGQREEKGRALYQIRGVSQQLRIRPWELQPKMNPAFLHPHSDWVLITGQYFCSSGMDNPTGFGTATL